MVFIWDMGFQQACVNFELSLISQICTADFMGHYLVLAPGLGCNFMFHIFLCVQ